MAKSNSWQNDLLLLLFNNTAAANIGDTGGLQPSGTAGSLYVSLHTADPGASGTQSTSEATYTSYARVAVARSSSGWTISGSSPTQAANTAAVTFPQCSGGSNVITFVGIGVASSGSTKLLYSGALTSSLSVSTNITPAFSLNQLIIDES